MVKPSDHLRRTEPALSVELVSTVTTDTSATATFVISGPGNSFNIQVTFPIHRDAQIGKVHAAAFKHAGEFLEKAGGLAKAEALRRNPELAG